VPDEILSLHCQLPAAESIASAGGNYLRSYWASGPGFVLPRGMARKLLEWLAKCPPTLRDQWNEDGWINMFAWAQRRPIWHPLPALVQHDTRVPSTLGYDKDPLRAAVVDWTNEHIVKALEHKGKRYWRVGAPAPFIDNPWMPMRDLVRLEHQYDRGERFDVIVATPHQGQLNHAHVASIHALMRERGLYVRLEEMLHDPEVRWMQRQANLVKARSRMLGDVYKLGASHLLFVDADCSFSAEPVARMLLSGKDFVQCPYPRRDGTGYSIAGTAKRRAQVAEHMATNPEKGLPLDPADIVDGEYLEIDGTGLGLTLISRECMRRMLEHYGNEPLPVAELEAIQGSEFCQTGGATMSLIERAYELGRSHGHRLKVKTDAIPGKPEEDVVALFQLMVRDGALLGEDMSFAKRWQDIGGKVWMYIGPGSPCTHHGEHAYTGSIGDFGLRRKEAT
jgi:hypothetical protein